MAKISRREFIGSSALVLASALPARALWPFGSGKRVPGGPADIALAAGDGPERA